MISSVDRVCSSGDPAFPMYLLACLIRVRPERPEARLRKGHRKVSPSRYNLATIFCTVAQVRVVTSLPKVLSSHTI